MNPRSDTKTIITAMKYLAEDGVYSKDGVANAAIAEAAERLRELFDQNKKLLCELEEAQKYADELVQHKDMVCLPADLRNLRSANSYLAEQNQNFKEENTCLLQYIKILQQKNESLTARNQIN